MRPFSSPVRPFVELIDDLLLAGLGDGQVDRWALPPSTPNSLALGHRAEHVGRLEQLLGRHAPHVEAGAAHLGLLDEGDVEPGRGPVQRGGVPGRPSSHHHDVVVGAISVLGRRTHLFHGSVRAPDRARPRSDPRGRNGRSRPAGRRRSGEVGHRIVRLAADPDLEVQVGPGAAARRPDQSDGLARPRRCRPRTPGSRSGGRRRSRSRRRGRSSRSCRSRRAPRPG